ncbi:MAG: peptide ABC transporter substrate-binding protein [Deltaproteobacteria bacterium]|nr:peptide ABC transporter substrate-binding protein [Deltaproteobacteria bacterium]
MKTPYRLSSVSLLVLLLLTSSALAENVFRVRLVSDPTSFDWNIAHTDVETPVMMNIMEGLVEFDTSMKVKPLLAESWTISPDQKTYTFRLKAGIKWSDGKVLTANDFAYSWQRLLAPLTAAPYASMLYDIEGAEDYNKHKSPDFSQVGIKAVNATTLQVKLRRPVAYFIQMLTFWVTFPLRQDIVEKFGPSWPQAGKTVVLGPFIPVSYRPQSQIVLKRNENYHGKRPDADTVIMQIINEDSTALNLFRSGQLDYARPVNFLELSDMQNTPAYHTAPYYRTCFINVNTSKYPFSLPKVRQALAMGIDRSKLKDVLHHNLESADSFMSDALFPQGKNSALAYNPVQAKKLLLEAVSDPSALPKIEFFTFASDENALLAQFIQDQLKKNLGINVTINMPEFSMYRTQLDLQSGALYQRCWAADYADPDTFFSVFTSDSGNNRTSWKSPRYDELVNTAKATPNGPDRVKLYKEALELLLRAEAPITPLYYDSLTYLLNPKIKNFVINPLNYVFFRDIVFSK